VADDSDDITILLRRWHAGDSDAGEELFRRLQPDLKRIAARCLRRERRNHSLQRTELVNEGFLKLAEANRVVDWRDRAHFFAISTMKLGYVLIDYARKRPKVDILSIEDLPEGIMAGRNRLEVRLAVHELLEELEKESPMACAIFVASSDFGYEVKEIAERFGLPLRTVERHLHNARRWLFERLRKK
jgi:RNA polymerase sigma-70 factor, ECF subfamily